MKEWLRWIPLFIITAFFQSITQVCLKKASLSHSKLHGKAYYSELLRSRLVWTGIVVYILQIAAWLTIVASLPLSVAFPIGEIEKIFMIFMALIFFKEPLTRRQWLSLLLICSGILCVALSAPKGF